MPPQRGLSNRGGYLPDFTVGKWRSPFFTVALSALRMQYYIHIHAIGNRKYIDHSFLTFMAGGFFDPDRPVGRLSESSLVRRVLLLC